MEVVIGLVLLFLFLDVLLKIVEAVIKTGAIVVILIILALTSTCGS